jgi:phosphoglycerate dehydrogenase-like enzyme
VPAPTGATPPVPPAAERLAVWLPSGGADSAFLGHLREALEPGVELFVGAEPPAGVSPRVLVCGTPSAEQLAACPDLERLVIPYAGVPDATRRLLMGTPAITVHNLHHNAASTAELAVSLLLAAAKEVLPHDRDLRQGNWERRYCEPTATTLAGGHAVVLGYGAVGQRVARVLGALDMHVTAVRRGAQPGDRHGRVGLAPPSQLPRLLPSADALIVCLPLTEATRGLLDAAMLGLLPVTAYVVNVGRGALIEERALYEALVGGRLAGAGLDVWYRYPKDVEARAETPPSAYPFHELGNVVLSPHRAGLTRQNEEARAAALAALLHALAAGKAPDNLVDLKQGY